MGTPEFAVPSLRALVDSGHNILAVVTQPDRPKGRGRHIVSSPIKQAAIGYGLKLFQPEMVSDEEFCASIRPLSPDICIIVAFGQILKKIFLDIPSWGSLNIHASLLPKYRGAAPIQRAIFNGEDHTGLTAMRMEQGLDSGPIVLQEEVAILHDETAGELHDRLSQLSGNLLINALEGLSDGSLFETPQDETEATYAPKIDRNMTLVKWDQPAAAISSLIRALDPVPGAYTMLNGKEIKLFSARILDEKYSDGVPGKVLGCSKDGLEVETAKGVVLIRQLQAQGKKRLPAREFLMGFPFNKDAVLG
ncbi:Methionyl-tRNA formyltransferase [uncultured Desulfobacterium sp.]|uniref:Methionyl-tRNA formyltransferase n=1 Tax=uncultured Desulfobacterium sp. TaxID=201089 RepID=A0A445N397_9BACT|nr:Methionyl-tRNA formyltransferase [uncultured Desulfobacterium sp.]